MIKESLFLDPGFSKETPAPLLPDDFMQRNEDVRLFYICSLEFLPKEICGIQNTQKNCLAAQFFLIIGLPVSLFATQMESLKTPEKKSVAAQNLDVLLSQLVCLLQGNAFYL